MNSVLNKGDVQSASMRNWSAPLFFAFVNQRTNGPVNAHLISRPKAQNIQNLEKTRSRNDLDGDLQYSLTFIY